MKRILHLFLSVLLLTTAFTGCVIAYDNPDTDETSKKSTTQILTENVKTTKKEVSETESKTEKPSTTKVNTTKNPETTVSPKPQQKPQKPQKPQNNGKKIIAFTFDDGPGAYTSRLLDVFKKNDAQATFFVLGNLAQKNSAVLTRMIDEGHEVGSHSWRHADISKMSKEKACEDLQKATDAIKNVTGKAPTLVRPPFGSVNDTVKYAAAEQRQIVTLWNVDTRDWDTKNADAVYNHIMSHAANGSIIICHDIYSSTVDAIERALPELIAQGYEVVTVTEMISNESYEVKPGDVYSKR